MTFITSFERNGIKQGREEGAYFTNINTLRTLIKIKLEVLPAWAEAKIEKADVGELQRWIYNVVKAHRVEDVFL
ncbi:hypothetical protein H0A71_22595 [Alcaligenaceae bacterium]|nr:hypothetical protein [Alcaligenaceae bacterium]